MTAPQIFTWGLALLVICMVALPKSVKLRERIGISLFCGGMTVAILAVLSIIANGTSVH